MAYIFKTLKGKDREVSLKQYRIDWDKKVSGPQKQVKDFLYPYWKIDTVVEEMRIPGSRLRVDLININKNIMVEIDGVQHDKYNSFMHGSLSGWTASIKRDLEKERWAEMNGLTYVAIKQHEIPLLTPKWFLDNFNVTL